MHEVQAVDVAGATIKVVAQCKDLAEANELAGKLNRRLSGDIKIDGKQVGGYVVVSD